MISSGMKRGLAATAISAMAVTGLPLLAGTASAVSNTAQYTADQVELLSQWTGVASTKNDGQNTTVRLEAAGGSNVSGVTFQYNTGNPNTWVDIQTVTRNDDGAFSYEWNATSLVGATNISLRAVSVNATTADPDASDVRTPVNVTGGGAAQESVNLNDGSSLGVFQAPYTGTNGDYAILSGTTSATSGNVNLVDFFGQPNTPNALGTAPVTQPTGSTTGVFKGIANIDGYDFTGSPDEITFGASRDSDDTEAYTLYQQTITTVDAAPASTTIPASQANAPVVVTVKDQNGNPIANAEVRDGNNVPTVKYTDANGQATFNQAPGTTYYFANATDSDPYEANLGDKRSGDVTVTQYNPAQSSLKATSRDGAAFDLDENDTTGANPAYVAGNDITVQVNDQNGNPINADGQTLSYYWVATPFDGSAAKRYPLATATPDHFSASETGTGQYKVAFPHDGVSGTYELFAELGEVPISGGGNIPSSKILTVKAGQSAIKYAEASPETGPAGGQEPVAGSLALEDGTGLGGRSVKLDLTYNPGASANDDATPDAKFLNDDGTLGGVSKTVTTAADGGFAVTVKDPAETPQLAEIGDNIAAQTVAGTTDSDNPGASNTTHGVDFLVNVTPASIVITANPANDDPATAGEVESFKAKVMSGDQDPVTPGVQAVPLTNESVVVTTDHGYFTDGVPVVTAGGKQGVYDNDGQSKTVTTDSNGDASFKLSIGRDSAFDDDGKVTSNIKATDGAVSDTEIQNWTSENPLNAGGVEVVFSPNDMQDSAILPKAPLSDTVYFDVLATDQFGNVVGNEPIDLSDNTPFADLSTTAITSDYALDGDFWATSTRAVDQIVKASWTHTDNVYDNSTPTPAPTTKVNTVTGTKTVNWYAVDYANSVFTLTHTGDDTQAVGSTVTETYTAIDQNGEPIADLFVKFFRNGPDNQQDGDGNADGYVGQDGKIQYVFQGTSAGTATTTAVGYENFTFGNTGDVVEASKRSDSVSFAAKQTAIHPTITAHHVPASDTIAGYDKMVVSAPDAGADATVALYRVKNGVAKKVKSKVLGTDGKAIFKRADLNGDKKNYYYATVSATATTKSGKTDIVGVK
ncbi:Ig-like domain-containing protein [Nocardioides sp. LS1]|uniref:beta strand repeat-containing protein n=1 Tax=Nocardioides sp. LS1 TaxID=1027620 RepID=UPI000F617C4F|nr:Ig-like domain-containing protein [Nocardioides sp. LS1]GCD91063.1 hypothetical protein NLS1_30690 [Nocardioides sp. LS1]